MKKAISFTAMPLLLALGTAPAAAHVGVGDAASFAAGVGHPFSGLDHLTVMVAVGLWAALKGGRAIWLWPLAFIGVMMAGGALGMLGLAVPFVEPGILASVVALGILVALAIDVPVAAGAAIIGVFALFHGHAHGTEVSEAAGGVTYVAGFAIATAFLHAAGVVAAIAVGTRHRLLARTAGAASVIIGSGLIADIL